MDLTTIKTTNGGVISVHAGSNLTTNLFFDRWFLITDPHYISIIKGAVYTKDEAKLVQIKNGVSATKLLEIGVPYRRNKTTTTSITPNIPTISSSEVAQTDETQTDTPQEIPGETTRLMIKTLGNELTENLMKFFSEFAFSLSPRFINTLARKTSINDCTKYIVSYCKLSNNPDTNEIAKKVKSEEFKNIISSYLDNIKPVQNCISKINNRLDIYFGDPGTGKTTIATQSFPNAQVITCNSNILPDDLMRVFDFTDELGKPTFKDAPLKIALKEGQPIILDEINLLPFDSLRFIQTLTDNKTRITYNGETIDIKPGFKIIGTMNLVVNGQEFSLPDPLVDRIDNLQEFKLSSNQLSSFAFGQ